MLYIVRACELQVITGPKGTNRCNHSRSMFCIHEETAENPVHHKRVVTKGFFTFINLSSYFHRQPEPIKFIYINMSLKEPSQDVSQLPVPRSLARRRC
jgi:hypothetical protein